jgi:hypothetical protein
VSGVLVAGVYPPVPGTAAEATLAAVRHLVADGRQVEVVSPRPSAAHHFGPLVGADASRVLARLASSGRFDHLVLCVSSNVPFDSASGGRRHRVQAWLLTRQLRRFRRVDVLVAEPPAASRRALATLWTAVDSVLVDASSLGDAAERLGAPVAKLAVAPFSWPSVRAPAPVSALGPPDVPPGVARPMTLTALAHRVRRLPPWLVHRFRVLVSPVVRPVLVRLGLREPR